jgi:hypothetical protein
MVARELAALPSPHRCKHRGRDEDPRREVEEPVHEHVGLQARDGVIGSPPFPPVSM